MGYLVALVFQLLDLLDLLFDRSVIIHEIHDPVRGKDYHRCEPLEKGEEYFVLRDYPFLDSQSVSQGTFQQEGKTLRFVALKN